MEYELGVLLFHTTAFGKVGFEFFDCIKGLVTGMQNKGIWQTLNYNDMYKGFLSEAENIAEGQPALCSFVKSGTGDHMTTSMRIDCEKVKKLFDETFKEIIE